MSNISYKFNLTLTNGTVLKIYDIAEDSKEALKITVLASDYKKARISSIFAENNLSEIIETSKDAVFIRKYSNYVGTPSVYEGSITVSVDKVTQVNTTKEVTDEATGEVTTEPTVIDVNDTEDVSVDVIFIEIPYVSPTDQKIAEMEAIVNPKLDVETASLDQVKAYVQKANSAALETFLEKNPMLHTDGKYYGVASVDRDEMTQQYMAYMLNKTVNPDAEDTIKWHSKGTKCTAMALSDFVALALAITAYTESYYEEMQDIKESIMNAASKDDALAIKIFGE